ncbi:IS4 family transposase, partial [Merismopedia glauca CCAP 1448/3]
QRYVSRPTEKSRNRRRHSNFLIGLNSETWTIAVDVCQLSVQELMDLNRNKKLFYQRGLRAITLIQQAF